MKPSATILITTRNRCSDLRRAVSSALSQEEEIEVIVIDDGSTDATKHMLAEEFPQIVRVSHETSAGYIVRRNEGISLAKAPIVFVIDDDAEFSSNSTIRLTLNEFDNPRIGAVAIPYINVNHSPTIHQKAPDPSGCWLTNGFIGTAHALRKSLFEALGGYWEPYCHQGEEVDYSIRMLDKGYFVRLGNALPITHHQSPSRSLRRVNYFGQRNLILFAWRNIPSPFFPAYVCVSFAKGLLHAFRTPCLCASLEGLWAGFVDAWRYKEARNPVSGKAYHKYRQLKKSGPSLLQGLPQASV